MAYGCDQHRLVYRSAVDEQPNCGIVGFHMLSICIDRYRFGDRTECHFEIQLDRVLRVQHHPGLYNGFETRLPNLGAIRTRRNRADNITTRSVRLSFEANIGSVLIKTISAPTTIDLFGSVTRPVSDPLMDWPRTSEVNPTRMNSATLALRTARISSCQTQPSL